MGLQKLKATRDNIAKRLELMKGFSKTAYEQYEKIEAKYEKLAERDETLARHIQKHFDAFQNLDETRKKLDDDLRDLNLIIMSLEPNGSLT